MTQEDYQWQQTCFLDSTFFARRWYTTISLKLVSVPGIHLAAPSKNGRFCFEHWEKKKKVTKLKKTNEIKSWLEMDWQICEWCHACEACRQQKECCSRRESARERDERRASVLPWFWWDQTWQGHPSPWRQNAPLSESHVWVARLCKNR